MTAPDVSRPLDLRAVSLEGLQVIEASAGTGKTRTITGIYLRLVMERDIPVEQILVVTYTVAATEELRERIRDVLLQALAALRGSAVTDEMAAELTAAVDDREAATRRVQQALANFDLAAIHTMASVSARWRTAHSRAACRSTASSCRTCAISCRRSSTISGAPGSSTHRCCSCSICSTSGSRPSRWRRASRSSSRDRT